MSRRKYKLVELYFGNDGAVEESVIFEGANRRSLLKVFALKPDFPEMGKYGRELRLPSGKILTSKQDIDSFISKL